MYQRYGYIFNYIII